MFSYESSEIDWCEKNYVYSNYIAEFWNTISNIPYILILFISLQTFRFLPCKNNDKLLHSLLLVTGISSAYFHATLSLFAQLLDEFSIILLLTNTLLIIFKNKTTKLCIKTYVCIHLISMWYFPFINIPVLFGMGFIILYRLRHVLKNFNENSHKKYWLYSQYLFFSSVICWISDHILCDTLPFIQFHAIWHLLSAICAYYSILVGLFVEYNNNYKESNDKYLGSIE